MVAVITHAYPAGVRRLVATLLEPALRLGCELVVVHTGASAETAEWLHHAPGDVYALGIEDDRGPASSRNAVIDSRPDASVYYFFDDDVMAGADELTAIRSLLEAEATVGIATGTPARVDGAPLATSFDRRPWATTLPRLWDAWWGQHDREEPGVREADVVSGCAIGVRGELVRRIGAFETAFWPACFEDLDFCARARFAGFRIVVGAFPGRQEVSTTMRKTFGLRYPVLCRSSRVLFAALDYPLVLVVARIVRAIVSVVVGPRDARAADGHGLLRCGQRWRLCT